MKTRSKITILVIFTGIKLFSQTEGTWINTYEPTTYKFYTKSKMIWIWDNYKNIETDEQFYGFYSDCALPSIDSLKHEKSAKYPYYFEVTADDFKSPKKKSLIDCGELNVYPEGKDTIIQIYYSSRQQFVTYKKVKTIPPEIATYLKSKRIEISNIDESNKRLIRVSKSTLYKTPNTPTKMYLVKGNEVEVLEQKDNWIKVRYYGKKTIEGWVKKEEVE